MFKRKGYLTVQDESGREVELTLYGPLDDIQIEEAIYSDDGSEVEDDVVWKLMDKYSNEICESMMYP